MNIEGGLFTDLVVIFAAAAGGGLAARLLRLPALLGYIALGILIGPDVLEFVDDPERVETFANLGVILLLFAIDPRGGGSRRHSDSSHSLRCISAWTLCSGLGSRRSRGPGFGGGAKQHHGCNEDVKRPR